jgi:phasin
MDNHEMQNAVAEQSENVKHAAQAFQLSAQKAGEQGLAAAKDLGDNVRALMEKSLHETRARYAKTKSAAEEASSAVESSYGAARDGVAQFNVKAIEALKSDAEANFAFLASLSSVKSISDMITLNTEFVRKRFEEATARAKAFSEMARKVADEAASPIRDQVAKTVKFGS